ncbi:MAG: hypothetical protein KatS3mg110_1360 [Pirellulaceae bacterium]|nr:MAG: hypothetical protein KatS3mg110_1360 [Pirellulaceae bacterium]
MTSDPHSSPLASPTESASPAQSSRATAAEAPSSAARADSGGPLRDRVRRETPQSGQESGFAKASEPAEASQTAASQPIEPCEEAATPSAAETAGPIPPPAATEATSQSSQKDISPPADKPSPAEAASDLDAELSAALGDQTIESLLERAPVEVPQLEIESRVTATVLRADRENVFLSLGGPHQGVAPRTAFKEVPQVGTPVEVVIRSYNPDDDLYEVVVPGAAQPVADWSDLTEGAVVEARITGANTGGLECMVNHIRGFIPASQIALYRVEHLTEYIGQKLLCVVTEANPKRRNLVLSRRAILEREQEEARRARLEQLHEGDVVEGLVRNIQKFGAFVDLGGVDGLIHVSKMSWDRVEDPSEVVSVGQRVRVRIEAIDRQTGKIALSLRSLQEHPWERAAELFPVGAVVNGTVSRLAKFGAFVKLAPGVEGLLHISELSHQRVPSVQAVLQEGQEIQVKVISLDVEQQRIGLSLKALTPAPAPAPEPEPQAEQKPPPEQRPKSGRQRQPLKGGLDRPSGGERFGLRW